ncbi:MAG TPA: hypothetical protein VN289_21810, partial [Paraburkholderia sp.]|nr:hypothetical protein [Paraburkholderia sp.]
SITFAIRRPEDHRAPPSSTHTYRLLVFKEHSQEAPCFHRVAASAAEKGDYEEPFSFRQQVFLTSQPADSTGKPVNAGSPAFPASPAPRVRSAKERNSRRLQKHLQAFF